MPPAAKRSSKHVSPPETSRDDKGARARIIAAATKLFAAHGYDGASTKAICEAARANIAAIHYHFGSKESLFRHIIADFGGGWVQVARHILKDPASAEELKLRLEMFLSDSLDVYLQHPELCRIVQVEVEQLHSRSIEVFRGTFLRTFENLVEFLGDAKKRGLISKEADPHFAAQFLFNQLRMATRAEAVNSRYFGITIRDEAYRAQWVEQTVRLFLQGISVKNKV